MAEIAATAFMALATAGEAAVAAAPAFMTAAETAGAAGLASPIPAMAGMSGSGLLSTLQGGFSVASAVSSLLGGVSSYNDAQSKGKFAEIDAEMERLKGEDQANRIKREMLQRVGDARVAYAGSGQDVSGAGDIEASLRTQAGHETELALSGASLRHSASLAKAAQLRSQGTAGLLSGAVKAGGQLLDYGLDLRKRG